MTHAALGPIHMYAPPVTARRRWFRRALLALVVSEVVVVLAGGLSTPPPHDVSLLGGAKLPYQAYFNDREPIYGEYLAPATSLTAARCEAWSHRLHDVKTCSEDPTLAATYWPELADQPNRLYVGMSCGSDPAGFNIEYAGDQIYLHCHGVAPWMRFPGSIPGSDESNGAPVVVLFIIPTAGVRPGSLSVVEDYTTERWLADQLCCSTLVGDVEIG